VEEMTEDDQRPVARDGRKDDGILLELREDLVRLRLEAMEVQVGAARVLADVVEPAAVRLPHRPAATEVPVQDLGERAGVEIVQPNLGDARALIALTPPAFAFAREEQLLAVGGEGAGVAIVVEDKLLGRTVLAADGEEAFAVPPE